MQLKQNTFQKSIKGVYLTFVWYKKFHHFENDRRRTIKRENLDDIFQFLYTECVMLSLSSKKTVLTKRFFAIHSHQIQRAAMSESPHQTFLQIPCVNVDENYFLGTREAFIVCQKIQSQKLFHRTNIRRNITAITGIFMKTRTLLLLYYSCMERTEIRRTLGSQASNVKGKRRFMESNN